MNKIQLDESSLVNAPGANVLILEPNALLGGIYKQALEYAGYSVAWEQNAQDAILSIDNQQPDIIIAELQLALHNGIEFLYELRSYTEWQRIPVIIVSGLEASQFFIKMMQKHNLGIVGYYYKVRVNLKEIINSVDAILNISKSEKLELKHSNDSLISDQISSELPLSSSRKCEVSRKASVQ